MFKIEFRSKTNNLLMDRKHYTSEKTFLKWKERHINRYKDSHNILCFKHVNNKWEEI